jgi:hypothetical protein
MDAACEQSLRRLLDLKVEDDGESAQVCSVALGASARHHVRVRVPVVRTLTPDQPDAQRHELRVRAAGEQRGEGRGWEREKRKGREEREREIRL